MNRLATLAALASLASAMQAAAEPYIDQVLEHGPQPALVLDRELGSAAGWPRGRRVEYNTARESGVQQGSSQGVSLSGYLDTPDYGALSLSATINQTRQGLTGEMLQERQTARLWRIDQLAMPLDGGWLADHSAGNLSTLQIPIAHGYGRIGLPASPLEGLAAQYSRVPDTQINASLGRPGVYSGLSVNGFNPARGRLVFAGAQHAWADTRGASTVGFQLADATAIADSTGEQDVRGLFGAWRWQGRAPWADSMAAGPLPVAQREGGLEIQANAMTSRTKRNLGTAMPGTENAAGTWVDARWRGGWLEHAAGLFYLEPKLRWGSYNAISDLRGLYWRGDLATRQWQLSSSAEWTGSVSGTTLPGIFASATGSYRVDTRNTAQAGVALRLRNATGQSAQIGWSHLSDWGQTQVQASVLRALARRSQRLGMDHSFVLAPDSTLALSLALERSNDAGRHSTVFAWGIAGSVRPWTTVSLEANLRGNQGSRGRQLNGNIGANWTLSPNWSLLAQLSNSRGQDPAGFAVVSALTQAAIVAAAAPPPYSARRVQMTLRYQDRAGLAIGPIGGAPGTGAGSISGTVFFDSDNNGRREASEAGVPDVTVRLNGRFLTRTNAQGRYEFPAVAAGAHRLEIVSDNVPLPWSPVLRTAQTVEVFVRSAAVFDFALRRDP